MAVALIGALALSCTTPDAVAAFCSSAVTTLKTGDALFDDMKGSCVREVESRETFGTFTLSNPDSANCNNIGTQADGLKGASKILMDYFTALDDLASFGSSKTGDNAKSLLAKVSKDAKLSSATQNAFASIAGFLIRAAAAGYQEKHLAADLVAVQPDVTIALEGLGEAVGVVYMQELEDEERKTATRYKEFLAQHPKDAANVILSLDARWQSDRTTFASKRNAALNYKAALETIAKGQEDLAAHARSLKAKELPGLLSPYAAQLQSLVPAIQKAYF